MHAGSWSRVQYFLSALRRHRRSSQPRIGGQDEMFLEAENTEQKLGRVGSILWSFSCRCSAICKSGVHVSTPLLVKVGGGKLVLPKGSKDWVS
jgi:hypothetical protein